MRTIISPENVCTKKIIMNFSINKDNLIVLDDITFEGGCNGNLKAIAVLIKGKTFEEIINLLSDIECRDKGTSCMKELCKALKRLGTRYVQVLQI